MGLNMEILNQLTTLLLSSNSFTIIQNGVLFLILYALEELLQKNISCSCAKGSNSTYTCFFFILPSVILLLVSVQLHCGLLRHLWCWKCRENQPAPGAESGAGSGAESGAESGAGSGAGSGNNCNRKCDFYHIYNIIILFFKIITPSIIWIVILFLDGDYYTCAEIMKDDKASNKTCAEFSCNGAPNNVLSGQQHHCDKSRFIGAILIFTYLLVLILLCFLDRCTCCNMNNYYYKYECDDMRRNKTDQLIMKARENRAEEEGNVEFNKRSEELWSFLKDVSETQQSNTGAEMTNKAQCSETVNVSSMHQSTQQCVADSISLIETNLHDRTG